MATPPSSHPRSPPALMEELVEEILLRIPPDEPAHLFRAALVCKPWRRIILSDSGFLRRYRALHRAPPLLGYFHNLGPIAGFVSSTATASAHFPLPAALDIDSRRLSWAEVHDCRHGRVLIEAPGKFFIVWDPITGDQKKVSKPDYPYGYGTSATVLCAVDGCDHLDCRAGAFLVVYCATDLVDNHYSTWAAMYNSDTEEWSSMITVDNADYYIREIRATLIIRDALYFSFHCGVSLLKYDLRRHELSMVDSPCAVGTVPMELDDGELGFVSVLENCIYMWSWRAEAKNGIGMWDQHMVMELKELLQSSDNMPEVIGFVEGTYTIFIRDDAGVFTLDVKSKKVKKVGKSANYYQIIPYMSFYTPDLPKGILSPP